MARGDQLGRQWRIILTSLHPKLANRPAKFLNRISERTT
jgi:hypothetical protein